MKALIRNEGETVLESDGIAGIDWTTGAPLTNEYWAGGKYTLVEDYEPPTESETEMDSVSEMVETQSQGTAVETVSETVTEEDKTVIINGQEFTKSELIEYINSL